ncbi:MAG: aspartate aminotransferase family protein [Candidatus Verstraetearchaeota archaeon]|nr:aspartate aminotransferase family protein [Candidatus Verstraetearchaeota archaeon]
MNSSKDVIDLSDRYLSRMYRHYYPFVPDRAVDDTVYSIEGEAYIDLYAGVSIVNVGWSNQRVIKAVQAQMQKLFHTSSLYYLEYMAKLAKKLSELSPGGALTKTFFTNSGSEANETAISLVKRVKKRPYIMALHRSFHGRTFYAMSALGQSNWKVGLGPFAPVVFAPDPYCYRCPLGHKSSPECGFACVKYMEDVIKCEVGGDSISALLAEPMLANGGMIMPPSDYFKEVKQVLDRYSILFIADEVQSGNGRTGKLWGIEHYGVVPDVMTTSKAIANGLPLGVTIYREELDSALRPGEHYSTLGGNALACAAAEAVLEELTGGLMGKVKENGSYFKRRLESLQERHEIVGDVRGVGFFLGVELVKDRSTKVPAREEAARFLQEAWKKKILVGLGGLEGNVIRIEPPLVLTREHIDAAAEAFDEILKNISPRH